MPLSVNWGLYERLTQTGILPNLVQRQQLAMNLADVKKLDMYLDRKVLFNEKVTDAIRRPEFAHFLKTLPGQIDKLTLQTVLDLAAPVQVIVPPFTETALFKRLWLRFRKQPDFAALKQQRILNQLTEAGFELVTINSGQLFSPLEKPRELAETALQWARPGLRIALAKAAAQMTRKPTPPPPLRKENGVRINTAMLRPPPERKSELADPPLTIQAK
jgi:hypothetical protein